jgi:hypothetical protein
VDHQTAKDKNSAPFNMSGLNGYIPATEIPHFIFFGARTFGSD